MPKKTPIAIFVLTCLIGWGARTAIGSIYGAAEAADLLKALANAGLYLGSATATASATTLALMLTLIGMLPKLDADFDTVTYRCVDVIAKLATCSLMISLLVLLAFVMPVGKFEKLPTDWYSTLYNGLFAASVLVIALLATTVSVTYLTLRRVVKRVTPGREV
ncbi:hypothetical protein [Aurantiacibacter spongiae]|uniref:Uncharacterized protein n=1 Tax=Aurantiacibacter spongiae TaxID=2488860 RepID=A0A3N5CQC7_9SPHN|nr:hypothetical protein [Aurantiacibacter spongiae]RPF70807.1 hypothetical protein EG799_03610 [Aurantiacibacter spongiae]